LGAHFDGLKCSKLAIDATDLACEVAVDQLYFHGRAVVFGFDDDSVRKHFEETLHFGNQTFIR